MRRHRSPQLGVPGVYDPDAAPALLYDILSGWDGPQILPRANAKTKMWGRQLRVVPGAAWLTSVLSKPRRTIESPNLGKPSWECMRVGALNFPEVEASNARPAAI